MDSWFPLTVLLTTGMLCARMEFWPLRRHAWSEMCEIAISLFSLLNSFSKAASFHNPWKVILSLYLDSKTQSLSVDVLLRPSLWYQSAWFNIPRIKKSNSTATTGMGENGVGGGREFVFRWQLNLQMFRPCFCCCNSVKQGQRGKMWSCLMTDLMKISPGSIHSSSDGLQKSRVVALFVNREEICLIHGEDWGQKNDMNW